MSSGLSSGLPKQALRSTLLGAIVVQAIPQKLVIQLQYMDPPGELGIVGCQFLDNLARSIEAVYPEPSRLPLQGACGVFIEARRMFHRGSDLRVDEVFVPAVPEEPSHAESC
jgi:hypothetical protein